jgi:hypothetical protein
LTIKYKQTRVSMLNHGCWGFLSAVACNATSAVILPVGWRVAGVTIGVRSSVCFAGTMSDIQQLMDDVAVAVENQHHVYRSVGLNKTCK